MTTNIDETFQSAIGAKDWMLCNPGRCREFEIEDRDPLIVPGDLEYVLTVLGEKAPRERLTREGFAKRGKTVTNINLNYAFCEVTMHDTGPVIRLLPSISNSHEWKMPTGSASRPQSLDPRKWATGTVYHFPQNKKYSCWIDCFYVLLRLAHAVNTQIDQLEPMALKQLSDHAQELRRVMHDAGRNTQTQEEVNTARDDLRQSYATSYLSKYPDHPDPMRNKHDIWSAFEDFLPGLPSFTMNTTEAWKCCDELVKVPKNNPRKTSRYYVRVPIPEEPQHSMSTLVQNEFAIATKDKPFYHSCGTAACKKSGFHYPKLVLDRLPPYLLIKPSRNISEHDDKVLQCFTLPIKIAYRDARMDREEVYVPQACVYYEPEREHFTLAWQFGNMQETVFHYDGLRSGKKLREKEHWWNIGADCEVVYLIYYRTSLGPR